MLPSENKKLDKKNVYYINMQRASKHLECIMNIYRGIVDFTGDENNPFEFISHKDKLVVNQDSTLNIPTNSYIYHGTINNGSYMQADQAERTRLLATTERKTDRSWVEKLEKKRMYFTNRQAAKAYGSKKNKPIDIMITHNKCLSDPEQTWDNIKVLFQQYNPSNGFEIKFEVTKELNLLDFSNVEVVRAISNRLNSSAFIKSFPIVENKVNRKSFAERDAIWLIELETFIHKNYNKIDGYYFCCSGLHEEIMILDPSSLKFVEFLDPEPPLLFKDIQTKDQFLRDKDNILYDVKKYPMIQYVTNMGKCLNDNIQKTIEQYQQEKKQYKTVKRVSENLFEVQSDCTVKVVVVDQRMYILYYNKEITDDIYWINTTKFKHVTKENYKTGNTKLFTDMIEMIWDDNDHIKFPWGHSYLPKKRIEEKDLNKMKIAANKHGSHIIKDFCIVSDEDMPKILHELPKEIKSPSEYYKKLTNYKHDIHKTANIHFLCNQPSLLLFPIINTFSNNVQNYPPRRNFE